jgi:hypothetical protein
MTLVMVLVASLRSEIGCGRCGLRWGCIYCLALPVKLVHSLALLNYR